MADEIKNVPDKLIAPPTWRLRADDLVPNTRAQAQSFAQNHWKGFVGALLINLGILLILTFNAHFRIRVAATSDQGFVPIVILTEAQVNPESRQFEEDLTPEPEEPLEEDVEPEEPEEVLIDEAPELVVEDAVADVPEAAEEADSEDIGVEQAQEAAPAPSQVFSLEENNLEAPGEAPEILPEEAKNITPPNLSDTEEDPYAGLTGEEIDALYDSYSKIPEIDLPEGEVGTDSGVVAIFCPEEFEDADKAAECAGRTQILSGWKPGNEDWSDIAEALRRGGVDVAGGKPNYGPSNVRSLAEGETYYSPSRGTEFALGKEEAERLASEAGIRGLKDERRNAAQGGQTNELAVNGNLGEGPSPVPAGSSWEPSWTLRDDPDLNVKQIERAIRDADRAREAAAEAAENE